MTCEFVTMIQREIAALDPTKDTDVTELAAIARTVTGVLEG
ncbi:hypothetical protein CATRI_00115 [Corynebacterium atrinae]|nr:hypothetical protein CATRI_00115 [Corynebacterium atrinae]